MPYGQPSSPPLDHHPCLLFMCKKKPCLLKQKSLSTISPSCIKQEGFGSGSGSGSSDEFEVIMGSVANPKTWVPIPYTNIRDCSGGFCSLYCPQWCFLVFPPPPPPPPSSLFPDRNYDLKLSPFVVAIIAVLACAVLLVGYYLLTSKYRCSRGNPARRRSEEGDPSSSRSDNDHDPLFHMAWQVETIGLDESVIRSITVCCYKKGIGMIEGTCSVCLSEFEEDESVRLLPKCAHAFHIPCIDTWLKSHSTCPLCRSEIVFTGLFPVASLPLMERVEPHPLPSLLDGPTAEVQEANYREKEEGTSVIQNPASKLPSRVRSDLGRTRDAIIDIEEDRMQGLSRTMSMDHSCQDRLLASEFVIVCRAGQSEYGASSSHELASRFHCKVVPGKMKRSLSSDRIPITRQEILSNGTIPGR